MARKKVLFVAYGGGHVQMVMPIALALQRSAWADPVVLGLTTAAQAVRAAGLQLLQFKDFLEPSDIQARRWGEELLAGMRSASIDRDESVAYLGLSFQDLVNQLGEKEAQRQYANKGRHCFLPVDVLKRILRQVKPDIVVSTSSPRAEHAAFLAAREYGIPTLCLIDSFVQDEALRLGARGYADAVCVFNESVKQVVTAAGADPAAVHCTGNPAFDVLQEPGPAVEGKELRERMQWGGKTVVLVPIQRFQAYHPVAGAWSDIDLPKRLEDALAQWALRQSDVVLCVRPRPGEVEPRLETSERVVLTGSSWPLTPLLHAVDIVVTVNSTVGLEGHIAGARVIQILGTPFDSATPWLEFGIADRAVELNELIPALEEVRRLRRHEGWRLGKATPQVVEILRTLA